MIALKQMLLIIKYAIKMEPVKNVTNQVSHRFFLQ